MLLCPRGERDNVLYFSSRIYYRNDQNIVQNFMSLNTINQTGPELDTAASFMVMFLYDFAWIPFLFIWVLVALWTGSNWVPVWFQLVELLFV